MPTNLTSQLHALERIDLIRQASAAPELEFLFRHNLTQEQLAAACGVTRQTMLVRLLLNSVITLG